MQHIGYLLAVFLITWALLFFYVVRLTLRERRLRREIASLLNQAQRQTPSEDANTLTEPKS